MREELSLIKHRIAKAVAILDRPWEGTKHGCDDSQKEHPCFIRQDVPLRYFNKGIGYNKRNIFHAIKHT